MGSYDRFEMNTMNSDQSLLHIVRLHPVFNSLLNASLSLPDNKREDAFTRPLKPLVVFFRHFQFTERKRNKMKVVQFSGNTFAVKNIVVPIAEKVYFLQIPNLIVRYLESSINAVHNLIKLKQF